MSGTTANNRQVCTGQVSANHGLDAYLPARCRHHIADWTLAGNGCTSLCVGGHTFSALIMLLCNLHVATGHHPGYRSPHTTPVAKLHSTSYLQQQLMRGCELGVLQPINDLQQGAYGELPAKTGLMAGTQARLCLRTKLTQSVKLLHAVEHSCALAIEVSHG